MQINDDKERVFIKEEYKSSNDEVIKLNTKKNIAIFLKGWLKDFAKRFLFFWGLCVAIIGFSFLMINLSSHDLDEILNYEIIVNPNVNDASLDIVYDITWKVLDSTTQGPLTWVQIGTPNEFFTAEPISENIKSIRKYRNTYVRIDFKKEYYKGDVVHFQYKIHNKNVSYFEDGKYVFDYTPAWFTDAKVDHIKISWLAEGVKCFSPNNIRFDDNGYMIMEKENLKKGKKVNIKLEYEENYFKNAIKYNKLTKEETNEYSIYSMWWIIIVAALPYLGIYLLFDFIASFLYDYRQNRGFRSGTFRHHPRPINYGGGRFRRWRWLCMRMCMCMCWKW